MNLTAGSTRVRWCGGGLYVEVGGDGVLVDAPPAVAEALGPDLPRVRSVVITGGRMASVGGLLPLLAALEPHRAPEHPLPVRVPLGEERGAAIAEVWTRHWPDRYPVEVDAARPGARFDVGVIDVETLAVRAGEPVWRAGVVVPRVQLAVRLRTPELLVAFVPGAAPGTVVSRATRGADVAVIEVGVLPWPRTDARWRMSAAEALAAADHGGVLWLVGDDGAPVSPTE